MKNLNKLSAMVVFFSMTLTTAVYAQERNSFDITIENNTDRPGNDYKRFEMDDPEPALCAEECKNDPSCRAFTYVKAGIQGEKAVCYLKNLITDPIDNVNCISGAKVDIPVQEVQTWKPMNPENRRFQIAGGSHEMMEILPDIIVPKANLSLSRKEAIRSAESIPELSHQLLEFTRTKNIDVEELYTRTMSGDKALKTIDKGKLNDKPKNFGPKGAPNDPTNIDWSGGIQLTPMKCISTQGYMYNDYYYPAARIRIS